MSEMIRKDVNEEWAHSGIIKAGDYCYLNYCATMSIEEQIKLLHDGKRTGKKAWWNRL